MKYSLIHILLLMIIIPGCFHNVGEIISLPPSEWSEQDAFSVLTGSMSNNFSNPRQIMVKVNATGYFPITIMAIQRRAQIEKHWTNEVFRKETDELLQQSMGLYYDWEAMRLIDAYGNFIRRADQLETIEFMVTIINLQYPCVPPMINTTAPDGSLRMQPLLSPVDYPCHEYDIRDLNKKIRLVNGRGDGVSPMYVWGRNHDQLTTTETLFIKFRLRNANGRHLLEKGNELSLEINAFDEGPIHLPFTFDNTKMPIIHLPWKIKQE